MIWAEVCKARWSPGEASHFLDKIDEEASRPDEDILCMCLYSSIYPLLMPLEALFCRRKPGRFLLRRHVDRGLA
jgi:hypothetical protein